MYTIKLEVSYEGENFTITRVTWNCEGGKIYLSFEVSLS